MENEFLKKPIKKLTPEMSEVLSMLDTPILVYDGEKKKFHWGNSAALELWGCTDQEGFCSQDCSSDTMIPVWFNAHLDELLHGSSFSNRWIGFPNGKPIQALVQHSLIELEDGRQALFAQFIVDQSENPEEVNRLYSILQYASEILSMFTHNGELLAHNLAGKTVYGAKEEQSLENRFSSKASFLEQLYSSKPDDKFEMEFQAQTLQGLAWHSVVAGNALDPITGDKVFLVVENNVEELKVTEQKLAQSEKLASLGLLVAGVAHEINNPLNFVYSNVRLLENDLGKYKVILAELLEEEPEILEHLEKQFEKFRSYFLIIHEGSERIKTIVRDLRAFSRVDAPLREKSRLSEGVQSTIRLIQSQYRKRVEFICVFEQDPEIPVWPTQLNQVFMNLMVNASQSIEEKQEQTGDNSPGAVTIRTFIQGKELGVSIGDTGCGMTEEVTKKIFEPFFTTKSVGEGTGMGMSISYGIIQRHEGRLEVHTELGKGSEIIIFLPLP